MFYLNVVSNPDLTNKDWYRVAEVLKDKFESCTQLININVRSKKMDLYSCLELVYYCAENVVRLEKKVYGKKKMERLYDC